MAENLIFTLFQQLNKILLVISENEIAFYKLFEKLIMNLILFPQQAVMLSKLLCGVFTNYSLF